MLNFLLGSPRRRASSDDGTYDGWIPLGSSLSSGRKTNAGVRVDEDLALTYSAFWCGVRIISETVACLPLNMYRRLPDGDRELATDHHQYDLVKTAPNEQMGSLAFREGRTAHQVCWGNGFAEIERDGPDGEVLAMWPIHPSRIQPTRQRDTGEDGSRLLPEYPYLVRNNDGRQVPMRANEVLHVPGCLSEDGVWGKSAVAYARESIGMGIATERHGATSFGGGNVPRVVISIPGMKDPEARKHYRKEWKEVHGSPDSAEVAILPVEAKLERLTMSNEDSQFLGTRGYNVTEMSRWLRLPPHMLGDLSRATFSNIEQQSLEFVIYSLMIWLCRWEEQLSLKLLSREERKDYYFEHELAGLLRGDLASRYTAYQVGLNSGFLTINRICRLENMPGIGPAGDQHFVQSNMTTAENILRGVMIGGASSTAPKATAQDPAAPAPPEPAGELLDVPDYRQPDAWSCGDSAVHSVCEFFGVGPAGHADYVQALGTTPADGTSVGSIINFLLSQGLVVTAGGELDVEDLARFFASGQPVICPVQMYGTPAEERARRSGHYVVVIGTGLGQVFLQDPSAGRRLMDEEQFLADWRDKGADGKDYIQFGIAVGQELPDAEAENDDGAGPAEPNNQPGESPSGPPGGPAGDNQAQSLEAARVVLRDVIGRLFAKEANSAGRAAANKTGDFEAWLSEWYGKHEQVATAALGPATVLLATQGRKVEAAALAGMLASESRAELRAAYNTDTPEQFRARLAAWSTERAERTAEKVLRGE